MKNLNLSILIFFLLNSCIQNQKNNLQKRQLDSILLKEISLDTGWQETPDYTKFILSFDRSKYKGKFNKVKIKGFRKVTLATDGLNSFNYYLKIIESDNISYRLSKKWKVGIPNFDFSGSNYNLVTELHSFDSVKFKMKLYYRKEDIKELIDSVRFSLDLYDNQNNDTTINFKFGINQIKWDK